MGSRGPDWVLSSAKSLFQHTCTRPFSHSPIHLARAQVSQPLNLAFELAHRLAVFPLSHGSYALPACGCIGLQGLSWTPRTRGERSARTPLPQRARATRTSEGVLVYVVSIGRKFAIETSRGNDPRFASCLVLMLAATIFVALIALVAAQQDTCTAKG